MNKLIFDEIMKLPSDKEGGVMASIGNLSKYADVKLLTNEKNELYYQADVNDILESEMDEEEMIGLRDVGWEYSQDKKSVVYKLS